MQFRDISETGSYTRFFVQMIAMYLIATALAFLPDHCRLRLIRKGAPSRKPIHWRRGFHPSCPLGGRSLPSLCSRSATPRKNSPRTKSVSRLMGER
jgi:hypothetical protein